MKTTLLVCLLVIVVAAGCGTDSRMAPSTDRAAAVLTPEAKPGYEPAYVNNMTVTINAIEVPNHAPMKAQADLYEVVYPIGWQQMGLPAPQCNPCDHDQNGIDFIDFHDHILDSMPGMAGYHPLWHVWVVVPAYNQNPQHDALVNQVYASFLPTTSEDAVNELLAATLPTGGPVAVKIDTQFYFLCAVVNSHAMK